MNTDILKAIYPDDQIFVTPLEFNDQDLTLAVNCNVPIAMGYTRNPLNYITAENYVRILSQASYLLADYIISQKLIGSLTMPVEEFREAAVNYQLFYRNLNMVFHAVAKKGESFLMELILKDFKEIKRLDDYFLFVFANRRTVISGEMSFVYKK